MKINIIFLIIISLAYSTFAFEESLDEFVLTGYDEDNNKKWELYGENAKILGKDIDLTDIEAKVYEDSRIIDIKANKGFIDKINRMVSLKENVVVKVVLNMAAKTRYVIVAAAVTLFISGMFGLMLLNQNNTTPILMVQDISPSVGINQAPTLSTLLIYGQVSGGTSLLLPRGVTNFLGQSLSALILGTVVADRRRDARSSKLRDRVVEEISISPGIHLRELRRHLDCAMGALQYHLRNLEKESEITSVKIGNSKHFFIADYSANELTLELTAQMRNPTVQIIIRECMSNGRITQAKLSRTMGLDKSLISYYVGGLIKSGILQTIKVFGREKPLMLTDWAGLAITQLGLLVQ